jgi:hypothetical protein
MWPLAQFPKFAHEKAHTRSRRADHLRQDWLRPTFLAKIRQQQKDPGQPFLARIEQLINRILFYAKVSSSGFVIRTITHSVMAETVAGRSSCPVMHPPRGRPRE